MMQELADLEELHIQQEEYRLQQEELERQRLEQERIQREEAERKKVFVIRCCALESNLSTYPGAYPEEVDGGV